MKNKKNFKSKNPKKDNKKRYERFDKMNDEEKYFWGLFILLAIDVFLLLKGKVTAFSWISLGVFFYLLLKEKIKGFLSDLF